MGVGPIRGGGRGGGPKDTGRAGGKAGAGKSPGASSGKADRAGSLVGPSGAVGSSEVGGAGLADKAAEIARALRAGEVSTKAEAARRLVAEILEERLRTRSKVLGQRIAEQLEQDPRLAQTLERIWQRG